MLEFINCNVFIYVCTIYHRITWELQELKEFCFQFALRHMKAVVLSEEYIKLDTSTKVNFMRRAAEENAFGISFF